MGLRVTAVTHYNVDGLSAYSQLRRDLGRVVLFRVERGSLHALGSVTGLPTTVQGIAAQ